MSGPIEELEGAIAALEIAGDALRSCADMLADANCDRWADQGGVGRPPKDGRVERLYTMSTEVSSLLERLADIQEGLA